MAMHEPAKRAAFVDFQTIQHSTPPRLCVQWVQHYTPKAIVACTQRHRHLTFLATWAAHWSAPMEGAQ